MDSSLSTRLHGGGGAQKGQATRLGGVRLFI